MLRLELQPQQSKAFVSTATEILYGGAAGGGKSHLIRAAFIAWALQIPGLQLGLFRRLYPDLNANHMEGPTSFPALLAPYTSTGFARIVSNEITFYNGSRISLNHCQHEKDKFRFQGFEFHALGFDELTHFTEAQYRFLRGRLRMTGIEVPPHMDGLFPRIISGTNPGGVGHTWVKRTFVDHGPYTIHRTEKEEGGMLRQYIPARLSDNPALTASDPDYENRLEALGDPILVRAMKEGDWRIAAGSMFGETWRDELHTVAPFAVPIDWHVWRGADDGFVAPAAIYWLTQDPRTKTVYVIAEVYRAGMRPQEFAQAVYSVDISIPRWQSGQIVRTATPIKGTLDSAAFSDPGTDNKKVSRGEEVNALLGSVGAGKFVPVDKWPGSRVQRVQVMHALLAPNKNNPTGRFDEKGQPTYWPGIRFFSHCKKAIETIPALPRDPRIIEDVDTNAEDHAFDGVTYGLQHRGANFRTQRVGGA